MQGVFGVAAVVAIWAVLIVWPAWRRRRLERADIVITALLALTGLLTLIVTAGNAGERGEMPFLFVIGLALMHAPHTQILSPRRKRLLAATVVLLFFTPPVLRDLGSIAHSASQRSYRIAGAPASQRFDAPRLSDFVVPGDADWQTMFWRAHYTPQRINDGLGLLRAHADGDSRLFVFAVTDPFSYALGLRQPRGAPVWWDEHLSFNDERFPEADEVFAEVNLIMIPIVHASDDGCCIEVMRRMLDLYKTNIDDAFVEIDRTEHWVLLRARGEAGAEMR
jgi:hypothetical protein